MDLQHSGLGESGNACNGIEGSLCAFQRTGHHRSTGRPSLWLRFHFRRSYAHLGDSERTRQGNESFHYLGSLSLIRIMASIIDPALCPSQMAEHFEEVLSST
jgi:hypothetical protein